MGMLDGKTAIITGSGRGIGKASAMMMAREGAAVVISDIDPVPAEETVKEIISAGGKAAACVGDVRAAEFPEKIIGIALNSFGSLEIIVNNAGFPWDGVIHRISDEQWQTMLDIHLTAPFRILRAAAPYIRETAKKEKAEGKKVMRKIVNIMSIAGTMGNSGQVNYSSAKAGLRGLTKSIAKEWGSLNVNCNAVAFGHILTRLTDEKEKGVTAVGNVPVGVPKQILDQVEMVIPMGRGGTVEEAAGGIFFLVSPYSDYVTGHVLHVDGGFHM